MINYSLKREYTLGKIDYSESGRKNCRVVLEYRIRTADEGATFSLCGSVWNPRETDIYRGGQCCDDVAAYFPDNAQAQRMVEVWKQYHLKPLPDDVREEVLAWSHDGQQEAQPEPFAAWLAANYQFHAEYVGLSDDGKADEYRVTFAQKAKPFKRVSTDWRQGLGHRKNRAGKAYNEKAARAYTSNAAQFSAAKSAPQAKDVLDCLLSDARAYAENGDVADFMENFGYDDFRAARRVWQACETIHGQLRELLGANFHALMNSDDLPAQAEAN